MTVIQNQLASVLSSPIISEKSNILMDDLNKKKFVFKVRKDATKKQVKSAVELMFSVQVVTVNLLNVKGKQKRMGRFLGKRSDWKKAYVTLMPGNDIEFSVT